MCPEAIVMALWAQQRTSMTTTMIGVNYSPPKFLSRLAAIANPHGAQRDKKTGLDARLGNEKRRALEDLSDEIDDCRNHSGRRVRLTRFRHNQRATRVSFNWKKRLHRFRRRTTESESSWRLITKFQSFRILPPVETCVDE